MAKFELVPSAALNGTPKGFALLKYSKRYLK